jgi:hypothetical protein
MANEERCRTKRVILEITDALAEAVQTGKAYPAWFVKTSQERRHFHGN